MLPQMYVNAAADTFGVRSNWCAKTYFTHLLVFIYTVCSNQRKTSNITGQKSWRLNISSTMLTAGVSLASDSCCPAVVGRRRVSLHLSTTWVTSVTVVLLLQLHQPELYTKDLWTRRAAFLALQSRLPWLMPWFSSIDIKRTLQWFNTSKILCLFVFQRITNTC